MFTNLSCKKIQYRNSSKYRGSSKWSPLICTTSVGIYLFKVSNRNSRKRCAVCSNLTVKTPESQWHRSSVFIVNFEHTSHLVLVFLLLTLNRLMPAGTLVLTQKSLPLLNPFSTNAPLLHLPKTFAFLMFSGGIETKHWLKMSQSRFWKFLSGTF